MNALFPFLPISFALPLSRHFPLPLKGSYHSRSAFLPGAMAPTLASLNWQHHLPPSYNNAVTHSGLGGPLEFTARFSPHQIYIAQALALAAASISVASSVVTFYWFLKMKRNFRHQ
jgi:hypothetical protein